MGRSVLRPYGWHKSNGMEEIGDLRLVRIADDEGNSGENRKLFGGALRVAAGDDDARGGIGGVEFADGVARLGVGGSGDGAGVQHDDVGRIGVGGELAALFAQLALDGGAIGLRCAAAKLFDVKRGHDRETGESYLTTEGSSGEGRPAPPDGDRLARENFTEGEGTLTIGTNPWHTPYGIPQRCWMQSFR